MPQSIEGIERSDDNNENKPIKSKNEKSMTDLANERTRDKYVGISANIERKHMFGEISDEDFSKHQATIHHLYEAEFGYEMMKTPELLSEEEILDRFDNIWNVYMSQYRGKKYDTPKDLLASMAGLNSKRANELRKAIWMEHNKYVKAEEQILMNSYAGCESDEAWEMREEIFQKKDSMLITDLGPLESLNYSLAGIDTPRAWEMRNYFLDKPLISQSFIFSLVGIDTEQAWQARWSIWDQNERYQRDIIDSLVGLDSPDSWKMRDLYLQKHQGTPKEESLLLSVAGIDTAMSWDIRQRVKSYYGSDGDYFCLISNDNQRAWDFRDQNIVHDFSRYQLSKTLAGLSGEKADNMRQIFISQGKLSEAGYSVNGFNYLTSPRIFYKNRTDIELT